MNATQDHEVDEGSAQRGEVLGEEMTEAELRASLITAKQAAEELGIKVATLAQWRNRRKNLKYYIIKGRPFYSAPDVEDLRFRRANPAKGLGNAEVRVVRPLESSAKKG